MEPSRALKSERASKPTAPGVSYQSRRGCDLPPLDWGSGLNCQRAMGQTPNRTLPQRTSQSNHKNPGSEMGGELTYQPKWDPKTVLTATAKEKKGSAQEVPKPCGSGSLGARQQGLHGGLGKLSPGGLGRSDFKRESRWLRYLNKREVSQSCHSKHGPPATKPKERHCFQWG